MRSSGAASPTASSEPFVSANYAYSVTSPTWTGTNAATAWDGKGSPGDGDPTVDILVGPQGQRAFVYGEPTTATLRAFRARSRGTNATVHPCPVEPQTSRSATVGGKPAIVDQEHCPAQGGPYAIEAFVVHDGFADVFFTYSIPAGTEAFTWAWFLTMLGLISFKG